METRRPYRSALRARQARATRRAIVEAGAALYVDRGFAGTTVDAIAERAGVSRKTVFTSVGGKVPLLKLAIDWALTGDDEPVTLEERPEVRAVFEEPDAARAVTAWAHMVTGIAGRLARLHPALAAAAEVDAEAASLYAVNERNRLHGARSFVERLRAIEGLRADLDLDRAADMASLLMDPLGYRRLVLEAGWTVEEYADWVAVLTAASLLAPGAAEARGR
ncbi:TetR/AcrR family transcriptional regulator [Nocardioides coralli]|uniref:TetR/AcrR family transcriptional regulator n=1 Tax=Nocardioides coralli TaxID=2872154 RepID=UPI002017044E|nr:TetR/AcrR family transcriptional regulator [Nocardioides coralli]